MSAGIVDHETGTRDMRRLGGLLRLMPISATLALVAAASMAGVPLLNGFLSKEMMLEAARRHRLCRACLARAACSPRSARCCRSPIRRASRFGVYLGPARARLSAPSARSAGRHVAPVAVLVVPVVLIGVAAGPDVRRRSSTRTAQAVVGGAAARLPSGALARLHARARHERSSRSPAAVLLLGCSRRSSAAAARLPRPDAKAHVRRSGRGADRGRARGSTTRLHTESLPRYLAVILCAIAGRRLRRLPRPRATAPGSRPTLPPTCRPSSSGRAGRRLPRARRASRRPAAGADRDQRRRLHRLA